MKVTIIMPVLNEIDGMRVIMPRIKREWYDQLIIVDANSTDGTREYAKENGYFLVTEKKPGIRNAFMDGFNLATGDIIITFSPDGNSIPELIPDLVEKMKEGYDMVIVSRYKDGAKSYDDTTITGFGNWMFTHLINFLHGGKYTDAMVIFRAYKKEIIPKLNIDKDSSYSSVEKLFFTKVGIEPLLSVRAAKRKLKIAEIPGDEPRRIGGKAKLQVVRWGAAYLTQVLMEKFFWP